MRIGTITSLPDHYSEYARITDQDGRSFTVEPSNIPEGAKLGANYAYKVEIYGNDSGLAYALQKK
ncbi:MAG: hypothetical protein AB7T49_05555 [Oligoflexales bacterium]